MSCWNIRLVDVVRMLGIHHTPQQASHFVKPANAKPRNPHNNWPEPNFKCYHVKMHHALIVYHRKSNKTQLLCKQILNGEVVGLSAWEWVAACIYLRICGASPYVGVGEQAHEHFKAKSMTNIHENLFVANWFRASRRIKRQHREHSRPNCFWV